MVRLMLDSSVLFALDDEEPELLEALLAVRDQIDLLVTSAQEHEDRRRSPAARALSMVHVPTYSLVMDESHIDDAFLGDSEAFELLRDRKSKHSRDALIIESAARHEAILVMRDQAARKRLLKAAEADSALARLEVWGIAELQSHVDSLLPR